MPERQSLPDLQGSHSAARQMRMDFRVGYMQRPVGGVVIWQRAVGGHCHVCLQRAHSRSVWQAGSFLGELKHLVRVGFVWVSVRTVKSRRIEMGCMLVELCLGDGNGREGGMVGWGVGRLYMASTCGGVCSRC